MDIIFIEKLERKLEDELPGREAQLLMAPLHRKEETELPDEYKLACVLALLYPKGKEWHIVLIERTSDNAADVHAGQLSFPGGNFAETDYSYQDCALRETEEEIGINTSKIGIVGELTSVYIPVSNYLIYPFVGFMNEPEEFHLQNSEVSRIIEFPLRHVLDHKYKKKGTIMTSYGNLDDVPYYDVEGQKLWGATAMIMSELEELIKSI